LKKRTKKLLQFCRRLVRDSHAKVFASFFKKKRLLSYGRLGKFPNSVNAELVALFNETP